MNAPSFLAAVFIAIAAPAGAAQRLAPADPARTMMETRDPLLLERARRVLIGRGDGAAPAIASLLQAADPRVREAAVHTLQNISLPIAGDWLRLALDDPDTAVVIAALKVIGARGCATLPAGVRRAATSDLWSLRRAAAIALTGCHDAEAVSLLLRLGTDADPDVGSAARQALLARSDPQASSALVTIYPSLEADIRRRILDRLRGHDTPTIRSLLWQELDASDPRIAMAAGATLAALGLNVFDDSHAAIIVRSCASSDPLIRDPATFILARNRAAAAPAVRDALLGTDAVEEAEALARLLVGLSGPAARAALLAIAAGDAAGSAAAVTGAVAALRMFRTPQTTEDLAWIYTAELPRTTREELCAAFEDLPRSPGARSGLLSALGDTDSNLRLRAFRVLLQYGASTRDEIDWLLGRILNEQVPWVRNRMARLLAGSAIGEGAREFVGRWIRLLSADPAVRQEAAAALENLADASLREEAGRQILAGYQGPFDVSMLHLLTRLRGSQADAFVADRLRAALRDHDQPTALAILLALVQGGGPRCLEAARTALDDPAEAVRNQALHTLLRRDDPQALRTLRDRFAELSLDERIQALAALKGGDPPALASLFAALLAVETEQLVITAIIERCGELQCPIVDSLLPFTDARHGDDLRIRAAEALAAIGGEPARRRLLEMFDEVGGQRADGGWQPDELVLLESVARAAARTGTRELAQPIARLLFARVAALEPLQYDTKAGFPFEETLLGALLDLARAAADPAGVAAAIEQQLDREADTGDLMQFPKALFLRLAKPLDGMVGFEPLRAELLQLALTVPPTPDHGELVAALSLARMATTQRDYQRAEVCLERVVALVDFHQIDGARALLQALGPADPLIGGDPRLRLTADLRLARARQARVVDPDAAPATYAEACAVAPHDAWLRLEVAGDLLDTDAARTFVADNLHAAIELAPFDAELMARTARMFAEIGHTAGFDAAHQCLVELRQVGLVADLPHHRVAMAEALVRIGRPDRARDEVRAAISLEPAAREWILDDPGLRPLVDR